MAGLLGHRRSELLDLFQTAVQTGGLQAEQGLITGFPGEIVRLVGHDDVEIHIDQRHRVGDGREHGLERSLAVIQTLVNPVQVGVDRFQLGLLLFQFLRALFDIITQGFHLSTGLVGFFLFDLEAGGQTPAFQREAKEAGDFIEELLLFRQNIEALFIVTDFDLPNGLVAKLQFPADALIADRRLPENLSPVDRLNPDMFGIEHPWSQVLMEVFKKLGDRAGNMDPLPNGIEAGQFLGPFDLFPAVLVGQIRDIGQTTGAEEIECLRG